MPQDHAPSDDLGTKFVCVKHLNDQQPDKSFPAYACQQL